MRIDELKLRFNTQVGRIIDSIFPKGNIMSGIANATVKFYIEQNMYVVEDYVKMFADRDGDIDTNRFLYLIEEQLFVDGKTSLDIGPYIQEYIPDQFKSFLPSKLIISKEDIINILR